MMQFFKKRALAIILAVLVLGVGVMLALKLGLGKQASEIVVVKRGNIIQEVFFTGTVKAQKRVMLSFERSGSIQTFPYDVGASFVSGAPIATLRNETERANVAEAEATLGVARAKLATIRRGNRPEEVRVKEASVSGNSVTLKNLLEKTRNFVVASYGDTETALHTTIDPLFEGDTSTVPLLSFPAGNHTSQYESEAKRLKAEISLTALRSLTPVEDGSEESSVSEALGHLRSIQDLFLALASALRDTTGLSAATLADYKDRAETARTSVTTSITTLQNHQNSIRDARSSLEKSLRELELVRAGGSAEDIAEGEQSVLQAEAKLRAARAALEKTILRAPFAGHIASKSIELGETIASGQTIVDFQGDNSFIVEASVPEADVAKLDIGKRAKITFDAYGDDVVLSATITRIEPGEKEVEGVPTYKTTFAFEKESTRLRSGLTTNITVSTVIKENVVVVPSRAVRSDNGELYVFRHTLQGTPEQVSVRTGSRGSTRDIEITEGLREGDKVILPSSSD